MTDTYDKLIKRITTFLEDIGMPKFQDRFPAMSVIQIIKDSGYQIVNRDGIITGIVKGGIWKNYHLEFL